MIRFVNVSKKYKSRLILEDINLEVPKGKLISIIGPFGCGKSTLLRLCGGLIKPSSGSILIEGMSPSTLVHQRKIGFCFQKPNLLPWRTAYENIKLPLEIAGKKEDSEIEKYFNLFKIRQYSDQYPYEISGGTQHLVSIIRSIILKPKLLLLDEPFSSVDEVNRTYLQDHLLELQKKTKKTMILVTHSISEAVYLSETVVILGKNPGSIIKIIKIDIPVRKQKIKFHQKFVMYMKEVNRYLYD